MLHWHILDIPQQAISVNFRSLEGWQKSSLAALDTVTKMVIDIAEYHHSSMPPDSIDTTPPSHIYIVRAAIKHMHTRPYNESVLWLESAEDTLQLYLNKFYRRWDVVLD